MTMKSSQWHVDIIQRHLTKFTPKPDREQFDIILSLVSNDLQLECYFPELMVLGEFLHGPLHNTPTGAPPWECLGVCRDVWLSALEAYRNGFKSLKGLAAYAASLRTQGYTNDEGL